MMKKPVPHLVILPLLIALMVALLPAPVYSLGDTISVVPSEIVNNVPNNLTVSGTDFVDGSTVVLLEGYGALATTFQNTTVLTAEVPAGIPAGKYTVTVSTGAETASCSGCLKVSNPPTPVPPTPTTGPEPFTRPQFIVESSKVNGNVSTNSQFKLNVKIGNAGNADAYSVQAVFSSADLVPLKTGGVAAIGTIADGKSEVVVQQFLVTGSTYGVSIISLDLTVTYYDSAGTSYSDKFTISLPTTGGGGGGGVYATSTPTAIKSSQLVITSYAASVDPLQPGETFTLTMTVQNVGNAQAQRVTMIVGGGSSGTSGGETPVPGGVSGGGGEFTNFAPVGASNVQSLGDLGAGGMVQARQDLIVNVSTNPGAYPMKVTFSYVNDKNEAINDEQVITLLVYSLPNVDVSFYRPPDPLFMGQPGMLPVQVVNIGKRAAVLGNIKLETQAGTIENGTGLIGSLDTGGYYTLDAMLTPDQTGKVTIDVTIDYTDDFNGPRTITRTLEVEVAEGGMEEPVIDPSMGGGEQVPVMAEETPLQKIWRVILGLLGLDSAPPSGGEQAPPGLEEPAPEIKPGMG